MVHKWHSIDAWRGYSIPDNAVLGASDTGMWEDSPCPSDRVDSELNDFQNFLKKNGIESVKKTTQSSNVFMVKRWVVVSKWDYKKAKKIAENYLKEKKDETRFIHDAEE